MTYKTFTAVAFALTTFTLNANAACPCAKWFPPTDCSSEYSKVSPSYKLIEIRLGQKSSFQRRLVKTYMQNFVK